MTITAPAISDFDTFIHMLFQTFTLPKRKRCVLWEKLTISMEVSGEKQRTLN